MHDTFAVTLTKQDSYRFTVDFGLDGVPPLTTDEVPPLGEGAGPNPARLLAAAVGNCLAASLLFCLSKARVDVADLTVRVEGSFARNEKGRLRIEGLSVNLEPQLGTASADRIARCLDLFEDFCIVTESVREGIDIDVVVRPSVVEALPSAKVG
jgi:uncharacterized OsmC-like protein